MNTIIKKQAIMQSLESMNAKEMDQLMKYIKDMLYNPKNDLSYMQFKQKAMNEIQDALTSKKKVVIS